MRKFLIKLCLFGLLLFAVLLLPGLADNKSPENASNQNIQRIRLAAKNDSLDILFVGNSYAYSAIIPSSFDSLNLKTFNLGTASAGPVFYELLVDDYLEASDQMPRTVAFVLSPTTFSTLSDNFKTYPIHRYLNNPVSNGAVALKTKSLETFAFLFMESARRGSDYLFREEGNQVGHELITDRGFYPNDAEFNDSIYHATTKFYIPLTKDQFDRDKAQRVMELAETLSDRNIQVVFIDVPTNRLADFLSDSFLDEYAAFKQKVDMRYPVIAYSRKLPGSHFRNIDHMNTKGAKQFSSFLAEAEELTLLK